MATISFTYFIFNADEQVFQSTAEVKLTKKNLKETEDFIKAHRYSTDFEDIPADVFDKCCAKAFDKALKEYPQCTDPDAGLEVVLEENIPVSLIQLLSDEVRRLMLTDDPYYLSEEEIFAAPISSVQTTEQSEVSKLQEQPTVEPKDEAPMVAEAEEEEEHQSIPEMEVVPTSENTLYLTIKQVYFDQIVAGTKKKEYREIKPTTYQKYLECSEEGDPYFYENLVDMNDSLCGDICMWNGGVYPYAAKEVYEFLHLAVGYQKERDEAIVEIEDITFEPLLDKSGHPCRFTERGEESCIDKDGECCFWNVVFHLGKIVELHRRKGE